MIPTDAEIDATLRAIGATVAPTRRDGVRTALTFFSRYMPEMSGMSVASVARQRSYLKAMDLSKPVAIVDLRPGDEVAAFRFPRTDFGEFYTRPGVDPKRLGIVVDGRQFRRYVVMHRVAVLSSYTSAFANPARGPGGAEQLIIPRASLVLSVLQWGTETR